MDKIFTNKRTYTGFDGETLVDMCIPSVDIMKIRSNGVFRLSQDEKGRIDRFVFNAINRDANMIDLVMYYNHIFNPFAIDEGDMMYTPIPSDNLFNMKGEPTLPDGSKVSSNINGKKEMSYAEKVEALARQGKGMK